MISTKIGQQQGKASAMPVASRAFFWASRFDQFGNLGHSPLHGCSTYVLVVRPDFLQCKR